MVMFFLVLAGLLVGCPAVDTSSRQSSAQTASEPAEVPTTQKSDPKKDKPDVDLHPEGRAIATFAGGCFWCMEKPFEVIDGVDAVYSGYTGGPEINPSYKDVAGGRTGHTEAVRIIYDPQKVSYELLLKVFWRNIDPTQVNGQFVDHGRQYRTGVYTHDEAQMVLAIKTRDEVQARFEKPIVTEILPAPQFFVAETYHQDFYKTNPRHYQGYRKGSGRDAFLEKVWGEEAGGYSLHGGSH